MLPYMTQSSPTFAMFVVFQFYLRRFHTLLTDVLVQMPLKVKELRNRADDAARNKMMHEQEGIQFNVPLQVINFSYTLPSSFFKKCIFSTQGQHFEQLMCCLSKLYDSCAGSHRDLVLDFWCPVETSTNMSSVGDMIQFVIDQFNIENPADQFRLYEK